MHSRAIMLLILHLDILRGTTWCCFDFFFLVLVPILYLEYCFDFRGFELIRLKHVIEIERLVLLSGVMFLFVENESLLFQEWVYISIDWDLGALLSGLMFGFCTDTSIHFLAPFLKCSEYNRDVWDLVLVSSNRQNNAYLWAEYLSLPFHNLDGRWTT